MRKKKENKREMNENLDVRGVEWYRGKIVEMIAQIENEKFLLQVFTIVKKHIEKRGG